MRQQLNYDHVQCVFSAAFKLFIEVNPSFNIVTCVYKIRDVQYWLAMQYLTASVCMRHRPVSTVNQLHIKLSWSIYNIIDFCSICRCFYCEMCVKTYINIIIPREAEGI